MVIEALDGNVIARIRSSSTIDSVTQCVTELVLNSLDAKSTAIAVRVDISNFKIQVVDNGKGISRENMEFLGRRYMTSKCHDLSDLQKRIKFYGFKGEALASIAEISQRVSVVSKEQNCDDTYSKSLEGEAGAVEVTKSRPSCGTTVTVEGFLSRLPVRQQCVKNTEIDNVRKSLEALVIIHPRVSFSLRNDSTGKMILDSVKCWDVASSFKNVHPEVDDDGFVLFKVSKNKTSVEGLVHKEFHESKRLQYVYVNKRPISCPKIQTLISSNFKKLTPTEPKKIHPVYVLHIKCPYSDIDLNLEQAKTVVFFKKFDVVRKCVEKMIGAFLGDRSGQSGGERAEEKSEFGLSRIEGAVTGVGTKRRSEESGDTAPSKSQKIVQEEETKKTANVEMEKPNNDKAEVMEFDVLKENSMFTNFPDNEQKGKDIIMDMFIKSVQVFPSENKTLESLQPVGQSEPFENESIKASDRVTLGVQTSQKNVKENMMVSVGVQAGPSNVNLFEDFTDVSVFPRRSLKRFVSDYDFDFSKIDTFPAFINNRKFASDLTNFDQTRKLFDFRNMQRNRESDIFADYDHDFGSYFDSRKENMDEIRLKPQPKMTINKHSAKRNIAPTWKNSQDVCRSPYFMKNVQNKKNILSLKRSQHSKDDDSRENTPLPTASISEGNNNFRKKVVNSQKQSQMTCSRRNTRRKRLNESKISFYFTPQKKSIQTAQNAISQTNTSDQSKDLFPCTRSQEENKMCRSDDNITITVGDEEEGQKIMERDVEYEKNVFSVQFSQSDTKKKTGMKTNTKDVTFVMTERFEFVPKGLSPILKDYGPIDSLSPEGKENLQNAVVESYEDELLLVKWQSCMDDKDPKKFFQEIYEEKSKLIESAIPNVALSKRETFENTSFSKQLFQNFEVIGQVDCKFIAVLEKTKNLVLLFDQHAVHERVRLEQLLEGYKNSTIKIDQNIMIFLSQNELILIENQKANLNSLGLWFDIFSNGIQIYHVPLCIYNKFKKGANLTFLIETLIKEIIETLRANNGVLGNTPKIIQNVIKSEACRGAIKFGDSLTRNECLIHLKDLAECNLPFQCAHGRPTLTSLITIKHLHDLSVAKIHFRNLK